MAAGTIPKAGSGGNRYFYMVFLPPGIASVQGFGCGVHFVDSTGPATVPVATITDGSHTCPGEGLTAYQQLTLTASHELYETMTDPFNGTGWAVPNSVQTYGGYAGQELGDLCDTHPAVLPAGEVKQRFWSNKFGECINGEAWVAPSFTRFATQDNGDNMGIFWSTGDGGIAASLWNGSANVLGQGFEIPGSNVPSSGQLCYWDTSGWNNNTPPTFHIQDQFTCFEEAIRSRPWRRRAIWASSRSSVP